MATKTFTFTGEWEKWNVPDGVKIVEVEVKGGGSGTREGGIVSGKMRVDPKDVLWVQVGKQANLRNGKSGGGIAYGGGGAGGDASNGKDGGNGGGGASTVRRNSTTGKIMAVAGGAGGNSGDSGAGGRGGSTIGETGGTGSGAGSGATAAATGGTQNQTGKGGTTSAGQKWWGSDGTGGQGGRGGRGGHADGAEHNGGGGGGGGYYPGGGGQAGVLTKAKGGGGAGGSNYIGGLFTASSTRGGGGTENGRVIFTWETPGGNEPPAPPVDITINGQQISDGLATKATEQVIVRGQPRDPNQNQDLRMVIHMSKGSGFNKRSVWKGTYDNAEQRDKVTITGLTQNTRYYLRIYTEDNNGKLSTNYRSTNFWTNRKPNPPELLQPAENVMFPTDLNMTFTWNHSDPDPNDPQDAWQLRYRAARTPLVVAGDWISDGVHENDAFEQWVIDAGTFKTNVFYEWSVRTRDEGGEWSDFATPKSFFIEGDATPPTLIEPIANEAIVAAEVNRFLWKFKAPSSGLTQSRADLRYRVAGTLTWVTLVGDVTTPGDQWYWDIPEETFEAGYRYEWSVRTYTTDDAESDWSESAYFWTTVAPGSGAGVVVIESGRPQSPLGIGNNEVFIYDRGGRTYRGKVEPLVDVTWNRKRDDISTAIVHVQEWDEDQRTFYGTIRTWMHEMVIYRDGKRVFEGPITRVSSRPGALEIEAKDVMAYVYRRIMRQGYNDSHRVINGTQIGLRSVVDRASRIIMNALSYDDPNVLAYLTPISSEFDARTSRVRKDYSRTAWEEVDDLAAHAGLDYCTSGRRILLWDTHNPLGRLPELRDGDFSDPPIVTEYGMSYANYFAVTNGDGVWGASEPSGQVGGVPGNTGWIEQLASSYGESEGPETQQTLSLDGIKDLQKSFRDQSRRNISGRSPAPLIVRVPDNSTLNPELNIGINQLVPGVWIPLRSTGAVREVAQWQKLDSMSVTQDASGEKIGVVMSPAPNEGQDPDADLASAEEG